MEREGENSVRLKEREEVLCGREEERLDGHAGDHSGAGAVKAAIVEPIYLPELLLLSVQRCVNTLHS